MHSTSHSQYDVNKGINLDLSYRKLTVVPPLSVYLTYLFLHNNLLTELPELPPHLFVLSCDNNRLRRLPQLPESLSYLYCSKNQLTELPELPQSLIHLDANNNQLTRLPELHSNLVSLFLNNNRFSELPELPIHLQRLTCANNELTSLVPNKYICSVDCRNNRLTRLEFSTIGIRVSWQGNPLQEYQAEIPSLLRLAAQVVYQHRLIDQVTTIDILETIYGLDTCDICHKKAAVYRYSKYNPCLETAGACTLCSKCGKNREKYLEHSSRASAPSYSLCDDLS
jgi:Leucine-rich repeat (LRR) protein